MNTWNLDALYLGFDDVCFTQDFDKLATHIEQLDVLAGSLNTRNAQEELISIIELSQAFNTNARRVGSYINLRQTCDTTSAEISSWSNRFYNLLSTTAKSNAIINKWISDLDLALVDTDQQLIKQHLFWIEEIKKDGQHLLDKDVEDAISKMQLNASNTWENMREYLTSTLAMELDGKEYTLSSIRNLAYSPDAEVRKQAYYTELKSYDKIKDAMAFALNSIKGQANVIADLRGYENVLAMTLEASRLDANTLEVMLQAMREALPKFHQYLRRKAQILGHENGLPFYDLFASVGKSDTHFTIEESKEYLVSHFASFSTEVSDLVKTAYENNWIDFYPRSGKVGGAFCSNLPMIKQSRVLTNFDHSFSDVVTLAHELGHAYHGYCIQDHSILNTHYTMPVAETASTFNETIIMNAAIKDAKTNDEKIMLIESGLQDATQVICDILSRYIFETNLIAKRKDNFLFPKQLEQLMLDAQIEAYGDGLDHSLLHPYMWVNKSHYYSADLNFYNFPYAFGLLFAKGLYAKYLEQGQAFTAKYHHLLNMTTIASCEDVAKIADIDLKDINFWRSSLNIIINDIDKFLDLTK